jgi:ubiquinone/menaquinone biosynthesis C-methylase UbiE
MSEVQQQVREFYDQVGWKLVNDEFYQNARYEDLRPVSQEYIHRCHLRVRRHLPIGGKLLLDAGSGPIQYPEYIEYSRDHQFRVCADISMTALLEARRRIGEKGLYVVCDIARLPFKPEAFDGVVSMHTIHHLPETEQPVAFMELFRVLSKGKNGVVVNGWGSSPLMNFFDPLITLSYRIRSFSRRFNPKKGSQVTRHTPKVDHEQPKGTFSRHLSPDWLKEHVAGNIPIEILVWRSVSVRFLRALIHPWSGGKYWLRLLYWLEEKYPHKFGEQGQYPLIVIHKN